MRVRVSEWGLGLGLERERERGRRRLDCQDGRRRKKKEEARTVRCSVHKNNKHKYKRLGYIHVIYIYIYVYVRDHRLRCIYWHGEKEDSSYIAYIDGDEDGVRMISVEERKCFAPHNLAPRPPPFSSTMPSCPGWEQKRGCEGRW